MHNPRPSDAVNVRGRGGGGFAGRLDHPPYTASRLPIPTDLRDRLAAVAEARRCGEHAAAEAEHLTVLLTLRLLARASTGKAVLA